ncbi:hypothetical protein SAY87_005501 [Trapa incisa]|uniref:Dof zinc finger protein n=1 Tax=Trapa incisa TaxID=236973 RepID=A0AAN7Q778_9MYRT|nr:hypothetical protein SAY87_005501 [Trapa incisa]
MNVGIACFIYSFSTSTDHPHHSSLLPSHIPISITDHPSSGSWRKKSSHCPVMDSSTMHHQEPMGSNDQSLESILSGQAKQSLQELASGKPRPQDERALKCPRCESTNTKFCYYNNYSLSQPRYFCKSCRRYWTKGGTLRNIPVGGGCRKKIKKRPSSSKRIAMAAMAHHDHRDDHRLPHQLQDLIGYEGSNPTFTDQLQKLSHGQFGHHCLPEDTLEAPGLNDLHGLYYGVGGEAGGVIAGECYSSEKSVLWGWPWPNNEDELSSISRGSWNTVESSPSWHSFLNSSLM